MNEEIENNRNPNPEEPAPPAGPEPTPEPQQAAQQPGPGQAAAPPPPPPGYYRGAPPYVPYPPPQRPRTAAWLIPLSLAIGCLPWVILFLIVMGAIIGAAISGGGAPYGRHVALIHISGAITAGRSGSSLFSEAVAGSEDVIKEMEKVRENDGAKVVVIRINSPGGSASGSEEIYNEIIRLRESGKTVYASMGDVAASGGYYIASACNKIYADSNTLTGSIGVIFSLADMSDLFKKIGYKPEVIKAGKYKDIGSPDRPLTPEERAILQSLVNETYVNFLTAVSKGRHIPMDRVKQLAEGRIYTGMGAKKVKLIDEIGGLQDTIKAAALSVGITGKPKVVEYGRKGLFGGFFDAESESLSRSLADAARKEFIKKMLDGQGGLRSLK